VVKFNTCANRIDAIPYVTQGNYARKLGAYPDASAASPGFMGQVSLHMIFSNYREIVTPDEAERYWQIFPPVQAERKIIHLRADG
jgi:hypothetical protein